MANTTASARGTNRYRATPDSRNIGHEHDTDGESRYERRNRDLERTLENGRFDLLALFQMPVDVLDGDGRVVDENTDRECETAERHEVDRLAERVEDDDGGDDG